MLSKITVAVLSLMLFSQPVFAQVPTTLKVNFSKAKLMWGHTQGTGGAVVEFRVKCGPTTGVPTITKVLANPAARELAVDQVITATGTYFCVVTAANAYGESAPSNEVTFDAGHVPAAPTTLVIGAN